MSKGIGILVIWFGVAIAASFCPVITSTVIGIGFLCACCATVFVAIFG